MTPEGRLRLWQTQDTARVPLAQLQLAPCLKGDQVRVVVDSANAPAGFAAELAQVKNNLHSRRPLACLEAAGGTAGVPLVWQPGARRGGARHMLPCCNSLLRQLC